MKNNEKTVEELKALFEQLQKVAKESNCELRWEEIKGTVFFLPLLPAE